MKPNLKRPCANCPFLRVGAIDLMPGRMAGIVRDLKKDDQAHFPCHKTTYGQKPEASMCMGAVAHAYRHRYLSVGARLALAVGIITVKQLDALLPEIIP
jgi:hypothetical protein